MPVIEHTLHDPLMFSQNFFVIGQTGILCFSHKLKASDIAFDMSGSKEDMIFISSF